MVCFEVFHNGQKMCTAGVGDYGVLTAILTWVALRPAELARRKGEGIPDSEPVRLELTVGGLQGEEPDQFEHTNWVESPLSVGDEVRIRVVESPTPDSPQTRYSDLPAEVERQKKEYVRRTAGEFGWTISEKP